MAHSGSLGGKRSESPSGHQDYGNWSASSKDDVGVWGQSEIIVDTKDTEAWPSIVDDGDRNSETTVCKSVIASSSQQAGPSECAADTPTRSADAAGDSAAWIAASKTSSSSGSATASWNSTSSTTSGASSLQQQGLITSPAMQGSGSSSSGWSLPSHANSSSGTASWQDSARDHKGSGDATPWQSNGPSPLMAAGGWTQSGASQSSKGMNIDTWTPSSHWNDAADPASAVHEKGCSDDWVKNQGTAQAQWKSGGQWQGGSNIASSSASSTSGNVSGNQSWTNPNSSTADVASTKPGSWSNQPAAKSTSVKSAQKSGEVLDVIQSQMMKAINTTESWGRTPIRQDTPWIDPDAVEGRKKEDTNTWNSMPNNGTGIWESLRKSTGGPISTASWDDKKAGTYGLVPGADDDPYVWNPTSKSKDNAMWDDVSKDCDSELPPAQNLWHGAPNCGSPSWGGPANNGNRGRNGNSQSSRTASVSSGSGGDGTVNGCIVDGNADVKPSTWGAIEDDGLQVSSNSGHPETGSQHWSSGAQGKNPGGWNGPLSAGLGANPPQSLPKDWASKADGGSKLWDQSNPPGGGAEWNGSNPSSGWTGSETSKGGGRGGGPWDSGHQEWPGSASNRRLRSDSDAHGWPEDAEIGEWSEQHTRREHSWTSASQRRGAVANKHGANPAALPNKMMNGGQPPTTRQQMIQALQEMGFTKESALKALLDNQMDLNRTIADLRSGASQQDSGQLPHILPSSMSEALSLPLNPHLPAMHPNTPLMNNAQGFPNAKSLNQGSSSRQHSHKAMPQQQLPFSGPSRFPPQMVGHQLHQQQVLQNLQFLITQGLIPASAVSRPANSQHIENMLKLFSALQSLTSNVALMQQQVQQSRGGNPMAMQQMIENIQHNRSRMDQLRLQLVALSKHIAQQQHQLQNQATDNTMFSELSNLTLNSASGNQPVQSQSRLYQWKQPPESDIMSASQPNRAPGSKPIHPSFSSPNLHGGLNIGNDSTWSTNSSTSNWPTSGSGKSADGNHMESQSPSLDSQIPEFIPGQPWQGMSSQKVDEDPTITPGNSAKQFLSVNTASSNGLEQFGMGNGESWSGYSNFKPAGSGWTATSASPTGTFGVTDPWNASSKVGLAPARPPPGLGASVSSKNFSGLNRSVSWAPGPSVGWDRPASQWLVIRNLAPQLDGAMLKSLCQQHGQLSNFYLNLHAGQALVQYNYAQDAVKAQKSLSSCVLSNLTLAAEFVGDEEVTRLIEHGSRQSQPTRSGSMQWLSSSSAPHMPTWSSGGNAPSGAAVGSMWGGSGMTTLDGSAGAASNQGFLLPGDLLGTSDYSM